MHSARSRFDPAILATLLLRGWGIVAGAIMILFVSLVFTKVEQGYYYTFAALLALQIFFELGLNLVIVQFVSHEAVRLHKRDVSAERERAANRIGNLVLTIRGVFRWTAIGFVLVVGFGGYLFFTRTGEAAPPDDWLIAWLLLCAGTGINLYCSPQLAVAEGLGMVGQVARLRLQQSILGYCACWFVLLVTPTLVATSSIPLTAAAASSYWLVRRSGLKDLVDARTDVAQKVKWRSEIFPMQWRIALSWASGYLIFQTFTPLIFAEQGAVPAGQLGLSLAAFASVTNLSMSWINAKIPVFGNLIAEARRRELRNLFRRLFVQSTAACVAISLMGVASIELLHHWHVPLAERFLPFWPLVMLALVSIVNHIVFALAAFMRAHKEEPMLFSSVISGMVIFFFTLFTAPVGVEWVTAGYFLISLLLFLPWTIKIFMHYWHRER